MNRQFPMDTLSGTGDSGEGKKSWIFICPRCQRAYIVVRQAHGLPDFLYCIEFNGRICFLRIQRRDSLYRRRRRCHSRLSKS